LSSIPAACSQLRTMYRLASSSSAIALTLRPWWYRKHARSATSRSASRTSRT
jgi:hypothetical protein